MEPPASQSSHRIALVSGGIPMGGSTTFLINFAGELARRGVPVEVLSFEKENPMADDFQGHHIPVLCLDQQRMIFEDRLRHILQRLAQFRPTVVVSSLGAVSFEVLRYLPDGIFRMGMGQSDDPLVYDMMRYYAPWMDCVAMVSRTMKQRAEAMPEFARVPVAYLPYGVPICPEVELPARNFAAPLRILYLGRLGREQKRVHLFPEILRRLVASGIPFHWTIAGDGGERGGLEAGMRPTAAGQTVSFKRPIGYSEVPGLLKQHDIYLLSSDYEGLPLSLLEAMGYGLVPVVSDLKSGISEVVEDGSNGILVPVDDVSGYARAIVRLHERRDELAAKSAAARERVKKDFSVAAMTDRWLAVFPPPKTSGNWPKRWRIQAPLAAPNKVYFSPPVRFLRRIAAKFKS